MGEALRHGVFSREIKGNKGEGIGIWELPELEK